MKTKILSLLGLIMLGSINLFAQTKTEKFQVYGNCGMCEARIETAANSVEGATNADWNKETKMLEISIDSTKTDVNKVQMAIAKIGHDTEMHKAADMAYDKLPSCCKFERPEAKPMMQGHEGHKH